MDCRRPGRKTMRPCSWPEESGYHGAPWLPDKYKSSPPRAGRRRTSSAGAPHGGHNGMCPSWRDTLRRVRGCYRCHSRPRSGIQEGEHAPWIPVFTGMTEGEAGMTSYRHSQLDWESRAMAEPRFWIPAFAGMTLWGGGYGGRGRLPREDESSTPSRSGATQGRFQSQRGNRGPGFNAPAVPLPQNSESGNSVSSGSRLFRWARSPGR